jgi:DNA-binding response OmpR family regulator
MPKILVVDDEPQLLFSLREFLSLNGYDVSVAESGFEALREMAEARPDLIISDIMMQDMDGHEFHRRVRALTGGNVPLLFLTAKSGLDDKLAGLRDGADDYLTKPFDPQELCVRVSNILSRVEQTRVQEKSDFDALRARTLARLAAQLREPIDELNELLEELTQSQARAPLERQRGRLQRSLEVARTLATLVDDLQWASADDVEQPLTWESVRIAPIVRRSAAAASRMAAQKQVQVSITCGGLLSGVVNEAAIIRSLSGLLEAAVELASPGGQVSVMARRARDRGLEFVVTESTPHPSGQPQPEHVSDALELARHVAQGHNGKLDVQQTRDGRQRYLLWVPGRAPQPARVS